MINESLYIDSQSLNSSKSLKGFVKDKTEALRNVAPVDLADAKLFLRVDTDDNSQDAVIQSLISAGVTAVESFANKGLITTTRTVTVAPCDWTLMPYDPIISIVNVKSIDTSDYSETEYTAFEWMHNRIDFGQYGSYKITYTSGFGAQKSSVPDIFKLGILTYVKLYFEDRSMFKDDSIWQKVVQPKKVYSL